MSVCRMLRYEILLDIVLLRIYQTVSHHENVKGANPYATVSKSQDKVIAMVSGT